MRALFLFYAAFAVAVLAPATGRAQPVPDDQVRLVLTRDDCTRILQLADPAAASYRPGVDVQGRPVAPADLGGGSAGTFGLADRVTIDLLLPPPEVPGGRRLPSRSETRVGRLAVDLASGQVTIDGRPIGDPVARALAEACARQPKRSR